jgi:hypothetical protein
MGHSICGLYVVDFTTPKFAWDNVVLMAGSYSSLLIGGVQTQVIDRVSFDEGGPDGLLLRIHARHGRGDLPLDYTSEHLPTPKVSNFEVDFRLDGDTFMMTE